MFAYWFLFVVSALAAASCAAPCESVVRALTATTLNALAWGILALTLVWQAKMDASKRPEELGTISDHLDLALNRLRWCWLPIGAVCIIQFGWGGLTEHWPLLQVSFFLRTLWLLMPGMAVVLVTWMCQYQWERWVCRMGQGGAVYCSLSLTSYLVQNVRIQAGWLLLPLLFMVLCADGVGWFLGKHEPKYLGMGMIVMIPLLLPIAMRAAWSTSRMEEPWIRSLLRAAGVPRMPVRLWSTHSRMATAVIVGMIPGTRMLVVSDALMTRLSREQLAMVLLHELAHVRRFHLWLRFGSVLPMWLVIGACRFLLGDNLWSSTIGIMSGGCGSLLALRWLAHWSELDADHHACRMAERLAGFDLPHLPKNFADAARVLTSALAALTENDFSAQGATWLHPAMAMRFFRLETRRHPTVTTGLPATSA